VFDILQISGGFLSFLAVLSLCFSAALLPCCLAALLPCCPANPAEVLTCLAVLFLLPPAALLPCKVLEGFFPALLPCSPGALVPWCPGALVPWLPCCFAIPNFSILFYFSFFLVLFYFSYPRGHVLGSGCCVTPVKPGNMTSFHIALRAESPVSFFYCRSILGNRGEVCLLKWAKQTKWQPHDDRTRQRET
jgi:hypothetical protein